MAAESRECLGIQRRVINDFGVRKGSIVTGLLHHTGTEQALEKDFVPVCEVGDFSYEKFNT